MNSRKYFRDVCVLFGILFEAALSYSVENSDICEDELFEETCPRAAVMVIVKAEYGHIRLSRCLEINTGHFGCKVDVTGIVRAMCNGQRQCRVDEDDTAFKQLHPCQRGLDMYLSISYVCIKAAPVKPCKTTELTEHKLFIDGSANSQIDCTSVSAVGSTQFHITVKEGQNIDVSSVSFADLSVGQDSSVEVGYLLEEGNDEVKPLIINTESSSERFVLSSDTSKITLALHRGNTILFLLFIKAGGCENLNPPKDMWMEREAGTTAVGCLMSRKAWSLNCDGVHWQGVIGNCTQDLRVVQAEVRVVEEISMILPKDVVLMIIISITAVLALIIITCGYVTYKRSALKDTPINDVALLHNNIPSKSSTATAKGNKDSNQFPQYTLVRLQDTQQSHQQAPPVPPRVDTMGRQGLRESLISDY